MREDAYREWVHNYQITAHPSGSSADTNGSWTVTVPGAMSEDQVRLILTRMDIIEALLKVCLVCGEDIDLASTPLFCPTCVEVLKEARRSYYKSLFEEFMAE